MRDGTLANLVWESLNPELAGVNIRGIVTGISAGRSNPCICWRQPDVYQDFVVTVLPRDV